MENDISAPNLGTHKLEGKLSGLLSCSCGYDCRIVFSLTTDDESGEERVGNKLSFYWTLALMKMFINSIYSYVPQWKKDITTETQSPQR